MSELIRAEKLGMIFQKGPTSIEILSGLDFKVQSQECVAIVGESGVGKSTFLQLLGAVSRPTAGEIHFKDRALHKLTPTQLAKFRNQSVGFIFQFHYLLPEFTAEENVSIPLRMRGISSRGARTKVRELLDAVGLSARMNHRPSELSGGEQQRVAIARALVGKPEVLLADEPTGNLDTETARSVADLLFRMVKEQDGCLVVATHNRELADGADSILRLKEGKLQLESSN